MTTPAPAARPSDTLCTRSIASLDSWLPLFQRLCDRGATASAKAAALAGLRARLESLIATNPESVARLVAHVSPHALEKGALDALVEVIATPPRAAGRRGATR
jgi:hypothetical protein